VNRLFECGGQHRRDAVCVMVMVSEEEHAELLKIQRLAIRLVEFQRDTDRSGSTEISSTKYQRDDTLRQLTQAVDRLPRAKVMAAMRGTVSV
jgi:hypothetical protein